MKLFGETLTDDIQTKGKPLVLRITFLEKYN